MISEAWKHIKKNKPQHVYLLFGKERFLLQETVQKLTEVVLSPEDRDFNLSVYDMEESPVDAALEDAETIPFMGDKKIVLVKNPYFLTAEKGKEKVNHNIEKLEAYIKEPPPYTVLVFFAPYEKLDERRKITKLIKKESAVIEANSLSDRELFSWARELLESTGKTASGQAVEKLLQLTQGNLMILHQEILKLTTFAAQEEEITENMVNLLVARSLEQNIFDLIDHTVHKRTEKALQIFYDLLKNNEEPLKILHLLTSQFRLVFQVKQLGQSGYGQNQIAGALKVHPFRVKLASEQTKHFTAEQLNAILHDLAEADYEIKTGKKEKRLALELFLLKYA
ncbi:DNA polymerase III subunit delta [Bacillus lacus]|uniref:DNA polymerase III subunit delta n=1 Tax=Metabacillus lacus TaxID=1983721 RepID=A0A7X2LZ50_9BACI|nr:DNA polymerase III subunit delta [Metabacillus lacus]